MTLPDWLAASIPTMCKCGGLIINNETLTQRFCSNLECPYHMAARIESVLKYFDVKGIGYTTALKYIEDYHMKYHLEILSHFFKDKPYVSLYEVAKLAMIPGHERDMKQYCDKYGSFEDMFRNEQLPRFMLLYKDELLRAETFFRVKQPLGGKVINIMITGEVHGYSSRVKFINDLNALGQGLFTFNDVGVRKTGVHMLIAEKDAAYHNKMRIAEERGIPVLTPAEVSKVVLDMVGGDNGDNNDEGIQEEVL